MKTQKCISILSLAVPGLLFGTSEALALPLLDLAGFTVPGASTERYSPILAGDVADGRSDTVQAIAAINASAASAGPANPVTATQRGVGSVVRQLAQTLRSGQMHGAGRESSLAYPSSIDVLDAETGNLLSSSTRDGHEIARINPCAMVQANRPVTAFDTAFCNDASTPNELQTVATVIGIVANPSGERIAEPTDGAAGDRITGELTEDLPPDAVLNTNYPGDESTAWPIQSSSPDTEPAPAALLSILVGDQLAATVPEPATLALLALGLAGIGFKRRPAV